MGRAGSARIVHKGRGHCNEAPTPHLVGDAAVEGKDKAWMVAKDDLAGLMPAAGLILVSSVFSELLDELGAGYQLRAQAQQMRGGHLTIDHVKAARQ